MAAARTRTASTWARTAIRTRMPVHRAWPWACRLGCGETFPWLRSPSTLLFIYFYPRTERARERQRRSRRRSRSSRRRSRSRKERARGKMWEWTTTTTTREIHTQSNKRERAFIFWTSRQASEAREADKPGERMPFFFCTCCNRISRLLCHDQFAWFDIPNVHAVVILLFCVCVCVTTNKQKNCLLARVTSLITTQSPLHTQIDTHRHTQIHRDEHRHALRHAHRHAHRHIQTLKHTEIHADTFAPPCPQKIGWNYLSSGWAREKGRGTRGHIN